jgi:hypothetical protein
MADGVHSMFLMWESAARLPIVRERTVRVSGYDVSDELDGVLVEVMAKARVKGAY